MTDIYVLPDTQIRPDVDYSYLKSIAKHISEVKPKYLIMLGDWHDMKSLSIYDKGKKSHEIFNYIEDIESGNDADEFFFSWLKVYWPTYKRRMKRVKLYGNHEDRIKRAMEYGDSTIREMLRRFRIDNSRWSKVVPFLKVFKLLGVNFSHYFPNDNSGKAIGTARQLLQKRHASCVAGHQQGFDYAEQLSFGKKVIQAIISGSCYLHDEDYKGPNNHHFRGTYILRNVKKGMFDIERFSLVNLMEKFK